MNCSLCLALGAEAASHGGALCRDRVACQKRLSAAMQGCFVRNCPKLARGGLFCDTHVQTVRVLNGGDDFEDDVY